MARIDKIKKPTESYCVGCGRMYEIDNFYKSINPWHATEVVPYCKDCCKDIAQAYIKQTGTLESGIWASCAEIGIPFMKDAYDMFYNKVQNLKSTPTSSFNYLGTYVACLSIKRAQKIRWKTFVDSDKGFNEVKGIRKEEEVLKLDTERFQLDWGEHDQDGDYEFLEYKYDIYTEGIALSPAQETLYRQLCLVELTKREKEKKNESTKEEQGMILALMAKLKIDQFSNSDKSLVERMIESQIAQIEETEPAELYDQKELYADYCGIGDYWDRNILRPLKNLIAGNKDYPKITREE